MSVSLTRPIATPSDRDGATGLDDWLRVIRAEYAEMPGLHLTVVQAARLWSLEPAEVMSLLRQLSDVGFLRVTPSGAYVRARESY